MTRLESLPLRSAFACAHHRRLQVISDGQTIGKNDGETGMVGDLVGCGEMTGMDKALGLLMDNRTNCLNVPTREAVICRINAGTGSSVGVEEEADGPLVVERIEVIERIHSSSHHPLVLHGDNGQISNGLLLLLL